MKSERRYTRLELIGMPLTMLEIMQAKAFRLLGMPWTVSIEVYDDQATGDLVFRWE